MKKSGSLIMCLIGIALNTPATAAKMYKWVDDKGTTHYGETIPPEYANKDRVELDKNARVLKKVDVLTPEERQTKKEEDAKKREADKAALDLKRRDATLINTYTNVEEIDLARKRNLQQVEARITSNQSQLKIAKDTLRGLQQEADKRSQAKKPIPESLSEDIQQAQAQADRLQKNLDKSLAEKSVVEARFDADKTRYKELTGK
jgi:uncharacterized protein YifN (PemK superfamily)